MVKLDISKATNQQLYTIAKDSSERLRNRYAAALELQKRRGKREKESSNRPS